MFAKIIFILLFLIITFSSFGFCIRNEDLINVERDSSKRITFFPQYDKDAATEPRHQFARALLYRQSKFTFPNKHHDNSYNINEIPTANDADIYSKSQGDILRRNPYNSDFNTGEYYKGNFGSTSSSSSSYSGAGSNNYPSNSDYPNTIYTTNGNSRDVPNYQTYNDPNYFSNNYAQKYGYYMPSNNRPHFNRIPNYSGRPISLTTLFNRYQQDQLHQQQQQYQSASPYPGSFTSHLPQGYPYPPYPPPTPALPPIHGNPFNLFSFPFPFIGGTSNNPLANFFNNFRMPSGQISEQFNKALEDIAKNDDLQCVPKLLCQLVGDPSRRQHLPEFITAPAFSALIGVLPSTSPTLVFGKAALLGITGGNENCQNAYTRCPQNEDDLLHYLNNHKGGFFKFFNGGSNFGDESSNSQYHQHDPQNDNYKIPPNYQQNYVTDPPTNSDGNVFSNFGLLSNLASLFIAANQPSENYKRSNVNIGNLLSGLVGNFFSSKKITKRSLGITENGLEGNHSETIEEMGEQDNENTAKSSIISRAIPENETVSEETDDSDYQLEGRIVNKKIYSDYYDQYDDEKIKFPYNDRDNSNRIREHKGVKFKDEHYEDEFDIVNPFDEDDRRRPYRKGKRINFEDENNYAPNYAFNYNYNDRPYKSELIFPDRTGTGNLKFDSSQFQYDRDHNCDRDRDRDHDRDRDRDYNHYYDNDRDRDYNRDRDRDHNRDRDYDHDRDRDGDQDHRYGKILTRPNYNRDYYRPDYKDDRRGPYGNDYDRYRLIYPSTNRYDYEQTTQRPDYSNSYYANKYTTRPYDYDNYYTNRYTTTRRPYYTTTQNDYTTRRPNYDRNYYTTGRPSYYDRDYYATRYTTERPRDSDRNVYVTNSKGVVEYYITPSGAKIYV